MEEDFSDPKKESDKEFAQKGFRQYGVYSSVVFQMLATIGLAFWGGNKISDYFELKNNLLTVAIGLLGLGLALFNTIKMLDHINKNEKNNEN